MTPHIDMLGLTAEEMDALRHQGFVSRERRRGRLFFKLRFRSPAGRQCVRYLGADQAMADAVQRELVQLQTARRMNRELDHLIKEAKQQLRDSKELLAPLLVKAGYHFHGRAVRRKRLVK